MNSSPAPIRWGILAPGSIARQFATGLKSAKAGSLVAVASRSLEKAEAFKNEFGATIAYGSYRELAESGEVDAIYIASPHTFHLEHTRLCLEAGKAVLCEKPMGINASEVGEMIQLATDKNVFLMEAMWTRFLPVIRKASEWIQEGKIGKPMMMRGQFCFNAPFNPESRLYDPALAGGAILDVGVYVIAMANMIFGSELVSNQSAFIPAESGVDRVSSGILQYKNGAIAQWASAVGLQTEHAIVVYGDEGYLHLPDFWHGTRMELNVQGEDQVVWEQALDGNGYNYQADEVAACLAAGKLQSNIMSWADSLNIHRTMDQARAQWGLKYPTE